MPVPAWLADGSRFTAGSQQWEIDYDYQSAHPTTIRPLHFAAVSDRRWYHRVCRPSDRSDFMMALPYPRRSDRDSTVADAKHVVHMTPEERADVFIGLEQTMEAILADVPAAERRRRRNAARLLDPRPTPWWKNLRRSAWPRDEEPHHHGTS